DLLRQLRVADNALRQRGAGALDDCADHLPPFPLPDLRSCASPSSARSAAIRWVRSSSSSRAATSTAFATPPALALPCDFTTTPLRPMNTAPLWLLGSRWCLSSSVAGRETRKPTFERKELVKALRSRSVTKRAAPSIALSAMLPEKPSVTTTSVSPRLILSASI